VEFLPFSRLTDLVFAPRVRNLLESAYELLLRDIGHGLHTAIEEFEKNLFKSAEKAANSQEQGVLFAALKTIKRQRADMDAELKKLLQRSMISVVDQRLRDDPEQSAGVGRAGLSLVDNTVLEESLSLAEIAAKYEVRFSQPLSHLAIRFAVVGGGAPIAHEHLPGSPQSVMRWVAAAVKPLEFDAKLNVRFFNDFERVALKHFGEWLDSLNQFMIDARIMPNLAATVSRPRAAPPAQIKASKDAESPAEPTSAPPEPPKVESKEPASAPEAPPDSMKAPPSPLVQKELFSDFPELPSQFPNFSQASAKPPTPMPARAVPSAPQMAGPMQAFEASSAPSGPSGQDLELFTTLRELLSGRRAAGFDPVDNQPLRTGEGAVQAAPATTDDVQAVLTVLQGQHVAPVMVNGRWVGRRISHIKQDALNQLRAMSGGESVRFSDEDSDTLDLVGMLFDHLMQEAKPTSTTFNLLNKLQVPLIKVALKDKSFFTRRQHSARQLLNAIAETSMFWVEDEEGDRGVVEKMQMVVDRVCSEFDNDVGIFDTMLGDLGRHVQTLQKKAEVSEKRHVEAAKGRERLELSRVQASEAMETRLQTPGLPELVRTLLGDAWSDVLALTILRQGEDSAAYHAQLAVADELISCFVGELRSVARDQYETIKPALAEGLSLVGFHNDEIDRTLHGVGESLPEIMLGDELGDGFVVPMTPKVEVIKAEEIVKEKTKITKDEKITILASLRKSEKAELSPKEKQMLERIKQMPFGTWFEFETNQQGEAVRRKLSWFSTVTGRCLFVNARGAKVEERTLDQLAKDLCRGNAKVWEEVHEGVIDKAWKSIVGKLKRWTGIGDKTVAEQMQDRPQGDAA
jgi:hypothetical protein